MAFNAFTIKKILAKLVDVTGLADRKLSSIGKRYENNYIRIVNYHNTPKFDEGSYMEQLKWYQRFFENVTERDLIDFLDGKKIYTEKPGILFTFDDGLKGNYESTLSVLNKNGFTGFFFVSSDLVGTEGYMTWDELCELEKCGNTIGCHTSTHHRMNIDDSEEVLNKEIVMSKKIIEENLGHECKYFCWCGGEEIHYTKRASDMIKIAGYSYGFMTNSYPVTSMENHFQLDRINVETGWNLSLVKFQVSGYMDERFANKRNRVRELTG